MFNAESKETSVDVTSADDSCPEPLDANDPAAEEKRGTEFDGRDMNRMGKLPQLRVGVP